MYSKILISLLILSVCNCDKTDQATSRIRFHRSDIPLSYDFTQIQISMNQTKPPEINNHKRSVNLYELLGNIQYAPIPLYKREHKVDDTTTVVNIEENVIPSNEAKKRKGPTEPRKHQNNIVDQAVTKSGIMGHNIDIQPKPLTNLEHLQEFDYYRMNKKHGHRETNTENYQRSHFTPVDHSSEPTSTEPTTPRTVVHAKNMGQQPNENDILKNQHLIQTALRDLTLHFENNALYKPPKLRLNEARAYNTANSRRKAHINNIIKVYKINKNGPV